MSNHRLHIQRTLILLALIAVGGCASRSEMIRLQEEVIDLHRQLEYEKQNLAFQKERLKKANEKAEFNSDK